MKSHIQRHFRSISIGFIPQASRKGVESTEQFLKRGGKITKVPCGTTGIVVPYKGTSHLRS